MPGRACSAPRRAPRSSQRLTPQPSRRQLTGLRQAALIRTRHTGARTQHAHTLVVLKIKKSVINRTLSFAHLTYTALSCTH